MRRNNILMVGPLAEAQASVTELGMNLFASMMMLESIERLETAEDEYKVASTSDDPDEIRKKEIQLRSCEATMQITAAMFEAEEGAPQ